MSRRRDLEGGRAMTSVLDDPQQWRERAAELRVLSRGLDDIAARIDLLQIADGFDRLPARAEKRIPTKESPP
jgi:hypothetical protein